VTATQTIIIVVGAIISASIASTIGRWINGESPVFYEWVYNYGENRIAVSAGLTEKLYINDKLADEKKVITFKSVELSGRLATGEEVRATITGGKTAGCELFVGNERLRPVATKTP